MQGVVPVRTRRSSSVDQRRFDDLVQAGSPSLLRTRFIGNALVRHSGLLENEEVPVPESAREGEGMVLDVTCTATKRWKDGANKSTTSTQPSPRPAIIVGSTTSNIVAQLSVDEDSESDEEGTMKAGAPSPLTFEQKLSRIYDSRTGQSLKRSRRVEKNENVQLGLLDEEHSHAHAVTEYREFSEAELKKNPQLRRLQTVYRRMNLAETIIRNSFVSANRKVRTDEQRAEELLKLEKAKLILFLGRKYNIEERIDEIIGTIAAQKTSGRGYPDASTAQNTTRRQVTLPPIAPEISRAEISARCQEITNGVKAANSDFYHLNTVDDFKVKALRRLTNVLDDRQDRAKDLAQVCGVDIHASKREDVLESRSNYKDMSWLIESLDLAFTGIDDGVFADSAKVSEALMLALKGRTRTSPSVPDGPIAPSRPSPDVADQKSARTEPSTSFFLTAGAASPSTAAMSAAQRVSEEISTALHSIHDPSIVGFSVLDEAETVPLMKREAIGLNLLEFMLDAIPDTLVDEVRSQKAAAVASEAQDDDAIIASAATPSSHAPASARSRATRSAQTRPATAVSPSGTLAEMKSSGSDGGPPGGEMEPAFSSGADSASSFDEVSLVADREMQPFAPPPRKLRNLREDLIPDLLRLYEMYDYDQLIERRRQGDRDRQKQSEEQMVADMEARVRDYRNRVQLPDGDDDIDLNNMGKKRPSAVSLSHHSPTRAETERSFATSKDGEPKPTSQPALSAAPVTEPVVLMEEVSEDTGERVLLREELTCGLVFTIIGQMSQADTAKAMAGMLKISKKKPLHFVKYYVRVTNKRDDTACIGTIQTIASKLKNLKANPLPGLYQSGMASKTIVNAGVTKNLMCLMPIKKKGKCSFENGFVFTGEVTDRHDDGETASLFTGEDGRTPSRGGIMSSGGLMGASTAGGRLGGGFGSAGAKHGSKARSGESAHLTPSSLDDRMRGYTLGSKDDDQCSDYSDDAEKFASIPLPDELGWMSKVNRDEMNLSGSPKPNFSPLQGSPSGKGFEGSQKSLLDLITPPKSAPSTRTGTAAFDAARASAGSGFKHPGEWGLMDPMHSAAEILAKNSILHSALLSGDSMSWSSKEGQAIQDALLQGTDISNMSAEEVASLLMQRLSELEGELSDGTFLDANGRPISAAFRARDSKDALDSQDKSSGLHAQPLRKRSSRRLVNPGSQPAPLFVITSSMSGDGLTAQQAQEYDNSSVAKFDLFDHSSHHGSLARTRSVASMSPGVIGKDGEFLEGSRSRTNSMYLAKSTGSSHGMSERERKREMEERLAAIEAQYNCEIVADQTIPLDQIRKTEQTKGGGASGKQPIKGVTTGASIKYSVEEELPTQLQLDQLVSKMPGVVLKRSADTGKTAVFLPMGAESASLLNAVTNKPKQKPGSRQRSGGESRDESAKSKGASTASKKKKADSKRSTTACFTGEADLAQSDDDRATEIFNRSTAGGVPHDPCAGRITNLLRSAATSVTSNIRAAGVSLSGASRSRTAVTEMDMMEEQARELYLQDPVRYDAVVDDLVRMALSQLNSSHEDSKNQSVTQLINIIRSDDNYPSTSSSHPPTYGIPTPEIGCATPSSMRSHDSRPPMRPRPAGQYTRPVGGGAGTERRLHDALPPDRGQRILTNYYRRGTGESGSMDQPRGSFDEMGNFINYEEDPLHGPLPLPTISKRGNGAPEVDIMTGRIVGEDPSGKEEGGARGGSIVYPLRGSQTGGPIVGEAPWAMGRVSDELAHHHQHSSEIIRDGDGSRRSQAQMGSYGFGADQLAEPSSPSDITLPQLRVNSIVDVDPASPLFSLLKVSASQDMHAAKKEDGENEVERILYEQMKAQLVLRTILQQMRALWARKQRETEEKKRDMMKRTFARAMELSWEIERGRVINLNKLINILDRRTGRVRGFIPYYNDENVLTGGRNPNVCPRFFLRDPRFTKSKPHLMAKRRRLLPIHLMREGSNLEEPNPHLMYGYTRHLLSQDEMDGIDPESIWVRRPKFSLKHPISYKDMRTTGERLRYRRRLQQAAPFQHPTLMQSPHPRNESHCPPYGKRG